MTRQWSLICLVFLFLQPEGMTQPTAAPTPQGATNRPVRRDPPAPPKPKKIPAQGAALKAPAPTPQTTVVPTPIADPSPRPTPVPAPTPVVTSQPSPVAKPKDNATVPNAKPLKISKPEVRTRVNPSNFKAGLQVFKKDCTMYSKADLKSPKAGQIKNGKKLWVDAHNSDWHKVHKSSGTVFIPANCLAK